MVNRSNLYGKTDYFLRIKHKPAQKELLEKARAGTLSREEIEKSGQALWIREALFDLISRDGHSQTEQINEFADRVEAAQAAAREQKYPCYRWLKPERRVKPDRGFDLEILQGEMILIDRPRGQAKVQYSLLVMNSAKLDALAAEATYVGEFTDYEYIELAAKANMERHPNT